jgi:drug/metabolite transporter (DMT)-like permease
MLRNFRWLGPFEHKHAQCIAILQSKTMLKQCGRFIPILALATAGCLWGTGFLFGKIALSEMPVASMVLFRFAFACIALLPSFLASRPQFSASEWGMVFAASLLGVPIQYLVQFKGLSLTTVSHASLMVGTLPMLLALAAVIFAGERLHKLGWIALASSTCGTALIALSSKENPGTAHASTTGDLLVVFSMFAGVAWILISKHLMQRHSPLLVTAYVFWLGTLFLAIAVIAIGGMPSLAYSKRAWVAVAEQGILATATTTVLWNWGLKRVPASQAGVFVNLEPLVGAILGVIVMHESLGITAVAGGVLIVGGALYFSRRPT